MIGAVYLSHGKQVGMETSSSLSFVIEWYQASSDTNFPSDITPWSGGKVNADEKVKWTFSLKKQLNCEHNAWKCPWPW